MTEITNKNVYIGNRYVPKIMGVWDKTKSYESLSIVLFEGASYTSKINTPANIDIKNEEYWVLSGNYNAQVEQYRQETSRVSNNLENITPKVIESEKNIKDINNRLIKIAVDPSLPPFNADGTGVNDATEGLQKAVDYLVSVGGGTLFIPEGKTFTLKAVNPTINNPKRVLIKGDNIHIKGAGTVKMTGVTKAYIDTIDDYYSSGRDVFTAFSFIGCNDCSIEGVNIIGEWNGEGRFRYQSPRAKGVGFTGCKNCHAKGVKGTGILGNLVNANDAKQDYDNASGYSTNIRVLDCSAKKCLENGFNFMGGTYDCIFVNNISTYSGSTGFESASQGLICSNNTVKYNKAGGFSFSGRNEIISQNIIVNNGDGSGEYGTGVNFTYAGSEFTGQKTFINNIVENNDGFAVFIYPGNDGVEIKGNIFKNNLKNKFNEAYITYIYAIGRTNLKIANVRIKDNVFSDIHNNITNFIYFEHSNNIEIMNNTINNTNNIKNVLLGSNTDKIKIYGNTANNNNTIDVGAINIDIESISKKGNTTVSGDGTNSAIIISHDLGITPKYYNVTPSTVDAGLSGIKYILSDNTKLYIYPLNNKPSGTSNIGYNWFVTT